MPQPIDVGSILGGRYKVTGRILASAEDDVILDGLDQVLNRPVSILVAAPENSANLTQSSREIATGERPSSVSILDLGSEAGVTYLIAARTTPADLLDLVVPTDAQDVYQEPFFTDTLGTEIFGSARDQAPSSGAYVYEDNSPLTPGHPSSALPASKHTPTAAVPATPPVSSGAFDDTDSKVTLWNDDDYDDAVPDTARRSGTFSSAARGALASYEDSNNAEDRFEDEDDSNAPRTGGRWLTGIIVGVLVVGALIFAASHIGTLFNASPVADGGDTSSSASQAATEAQPATATPSSAPVVAPVIKGLTDITAYAPGAQHYNDIFMPRLKDAIDGNKGTYWPTVEFTDDAFAHVTTSIDLAVELAQESTVSSVTINQIAGSGGQFNILTNSKPSLEGAVKIGSGSFTAPDFTLKVAAGVKAQYVIINFTQLPKLQPFATYPYGLKIAEISIQ